MKGSAPRSRALALFSRQRGSSRELFQREGALPSSPPAPCASNQGTRSRSQPDIHPLGGLEAPRDFEKSFHIPAGFHLSLLEAGVPLQRPKSLGTPRSMDQTRSPSPKPRSYLLA